MSNEETYTYVLEAIREQPLLPNGTRELTNVQIVFDPRELLSRAKRAYREAELMWYSSMDLSIVGHERIEHNPIWLHCATPDGHVNSNYGWCVFSEENYKQYEHALATLVKDQWSRQSTCIYTRPAIQVEHDDGVHADHDFICTFATQHMIRDGKLDYTVLMRSNDADTGLPYDLAWHQFVYEKMLYALREHYAVDEGAIFWYATSLHLYERVDL